MLCCKCLEFIWIDKESVTILPSLKRAHLFMQNPEFMLKLLHSADLARMCDKHIEDRKKASDN